MTRRELTMTTICKTCGDQFGMWRERCPSCGTTSHVDRAAMLKPREEPAPAKTRRRRDQKRPFECVLCRRKVKDNRRCPHCEELVHHDCLVVHDAPCRQFQAERLAAEQELRQQVMRNVADRLSALPNPSDVAKKIIDLVRKS